MNTPTATRRQLSCTLALLAVLALAPAATAAIYYPPAGESLAEQDPRTPAEVGLDPSVVADLTGTAGRWALWRHGYLVHVEGNFNQTDEVKSVRKTWLAMAVGAAIGQGRLASLQEKVSALETDLSGNDVEATWAHLLSHSASFDVAGCASSLTPLPGELWSYSDATFLRLSNGLKKIYDAGQETTLKRAYFEAIGMQGWGVQNDPEDGIRLVLDLEDMGRLGLLALGGGRWNGAQVVPEWFVRALTTKQTRSMAVDYESCPDFDGVFPSQLGLDPVNFPEAPSGFLAWVNEDGDLVPGADTGWAAALGSAGAPGNGFYIAWNPSNGLVFAASEVDFTVAGNAIPGILDSNVTGPNPLAPAEPLTATGCGDGVLDPGEACDDGNNAWRDGCRADCSEELCGDGALDIGEQCDDGNLVPGDGCDELCLVDEATPACGDGLDNDGDGLIDLDDPGCESAADTFERGPDFVCDNGIDEDADGDFDFPDDPGCRSPTWSFENPGCDDDLDNDGNGRIDWDGGSGGVEPDPKCARPSDAESAACGFGAELLLLALPLAALRRARR